MKKKRRCDSPCSVAFSLRATRLKMRSARPGKFGRVSARPRCFESPLGVGLGKKIRPAQIWAGREWISDGPSVIDTQDGNL